MTMSGGEMANVIGNSLLGYFVGRKAQDRQGEIANTSAALSDPFAKQRGYYQGILGKLYGMPEGYGEPPPGSDGGPSNEFEKLYASLADKFGGDSHGGGAGLGALFGGGGGMLTGGLLGKLLG